MCGQSGSPTCVQARRRTRRGNHSNRGSVRKECTNLKLLGLEAVQDVVKRRVGGAVIILRHHQPRIRVAGLAHVKIVLAELLQHFGDRSTPSCQP